MNFGECNSSKFEIEISDIEDISGLKIQAYVKVTGYENEIDLFTGYVFSAQKQPELSSRKIIAYDELRKHADDDVSEWYKNLFTSTNKPEYKGEWSSTGRYLSNNTVKYGDVYYQYLCTADSKFSIVTDYDDNGNEITATYKAADYLVGKSPEDILLDSNICQYVQQLEIYNPFNYSSVTIRAFRDSLCNYVGIHQEETVLINDDMLITKTLESNELKFSDCIKAICQINAVFGHISEAGVLQYVSLVDSVEDFSGNYKATSTDYEEFSTKPIDSIRLYGNAGEIAAVYGSGNNSWNIGNNFLIYQLSSDTLNKIAKRLYEKVHAITYVPLSLVALVSIFAVKMGALLAFTSHTGEEVKSYVLNDRLSGTQLTSQTITAYGSEVRSNSLSISDSLGVLASQTTAIVEKIYEKITADSAEIKVLSGNLANYKVVIAETVQAVNGDIENLKSKSITTENFEAKVAELGYLTAETADLKYATITSLNTTDAKINYLASIAITTDNLSANVATLGYATVGSLDAAVARIGTLETETIKLSNLSAEVAKLGYAT
ncbi:MAG: hypothetical protein J6J03_05920, partial [Tyzzerella sp.]|nr:hypothetical protein [Tyzzerella sp.]